MKRPLAIFLFFRKEKGRQAYKIWENVVTLRANKTPFYMKKVLFYLISIALCYFCQPVSAQGKGDDYQKQARENLAQKEYIRARYMFLQAYNAYAADAQYAKAVPCGVQAAALYHRENLYTEAFQLLYGIEQKLISGATGGEKQLSALRYPVTRERLRMYVKLRNPSRAKEQLDKLEGWAEAAGVDSLDTDLLYTQANYYYTFGMNSQGDGAFNQLVDRYARQKDYAKAEACYKELIARGRSAGNAGMLARAYERYMAWHDSIQGITAQEKYDALKAQYDASLQTIEEKDSSLSARQYTIIGLCVLAAVLAAALVLGGMALMRFVLLTRKQKKLMEAMNEHSALKTKFIHNISAQMQPTLDTLDARQPGVRALKDFSAHIEELSALEDSLNEPYPVEETNVSAFCEELMAQVRGTEKAGVTLTVNAPKLSVGINREHVSKVLLHLLQNAVEHTPADGKIWLDFKKRGAHTHQFVVTDTGSGIAAEARENLFKPFCGVKDLTQGDGLGLPICSLEAMKMNGSLALDTEYTRGARFVLELHA